MHPGRAVLVALAALLLAAPAFASEQHPTQSELEGEIVCPVCQPETLDQSNAPIALRMKAFIARRIAAGDTRTQIENKLIATFGPSVVARPSTHGFDLVAWLLPLAGIIAGAVVLGVAAWGWSRRRPPPSAGGPPLDPELERRVDEELARFES